MSTLQHSFVDYAALRAQARRALATRFPDYFRDRDAIFDVSRAFYAWDEFDKSATFETSINLFKKKHPVTIVVTALHIGFRMWQPSGERLGVFDCELYRVDGDVWVLMTNTFDVEDSWLFTREQTERLANQKFWQKGHTPLIRGEKTIVHAFVSPQRGLSSTREAFGYLSAAIEIYTGNQARIEAKEAAEKAAKEARREAARARKEANAAKTEIE
ncbi:hypothetical protein AWB80_06890 [Caballeronia pedi]|uniref:Uncharacterized protein n=1 Tax=Caballeronia pedi TaxID=1777141 RepID=A0A158DH72_9BURK|nr:hypothetical protein [Caballeronia pedi]SAK93918.1 hypothetical protein AWB80_06890 [Caballeronia pedi]